MPDPGNADFAFANLREIGLPAYCRPLGEERRNEDAGEEIALMPVGAGSQPTRVERWFLAPFSDALMRFRWLFLEKGIGTGQQAYKLGRVNQNLSRR